jgi:subtilase family serine protease
LLSGFGALAACSSPDGGPTASSSQAAAGTSMMAMTPSWASSASFAGRVDAATPVQLQVHLAMHDFAGAQALFARVSDPDDALYGRFLSDAEFAARFAPTAADVAAVRAHLEGHGLTVSFVPSNNAFLSVEGTAAKVEAAFGTRLGQYRVSGEVRQAPMDPVRLPATVGARVLTVLGLATPAKMKTNLAYQKGQGPDDNVAPNTCSEWFGQKLDTEDPAYGGGFPSPLSYTPCGYHTGSLRHAYGMEALVRAGNDGTGQKIAIVDAFTPPTLVQDVQTYFAQNDADYPLSSSQITLLQGPGTLGTIDKGWYGESTLDVTAVHGMAPGADIVYVGAVSANDPDLISAINMIVTGHLATVISNSWDGLEAQTTDFAAWQSMAIQAGLKGIGLYYASGDNGDESQGSQGNNGVPTVDFPASLAEVTSVGGTTLALGADGNRLFEVGWEDGFSQLQFSDGGVPSNSTPDAGGATYVPAAPGGWGFGAGGGVSEVYLQPTWQKGIVPASMSTFMNATDRTLPDVAMLADPYTGLIIGITSSRSGIYREEAIGGTSLATPLFTATMALAQQYTGKKFGSANAALYKASKRSAFSDIAPTNPEGVAYPGGQVTTFDYHGTENTNFTAVGYDTATGLGVPNGVKFLKALK